MKEDFLHFVWKYGLYHREKLQTFDLQGLKVIQSGQQNSHAGPDFFNAQLQIDNTLWAGTVEIHVRSSDWYKHNHQLDPAYDNVILHVVYKHDQAVIRMDGSEIPVLELQGKIDTSLLHTYQLLIENLAQIPCEQRINEVDDFNKRSWIERMGIERLEYKSNVIKDALQKNRGDWEKICFEWMVRNFGFNVNADAFEQLAQSIDYKILLKNSDDLFKLEALLFGQAGMLQYPFEEAYPKALKKEYAFLKKKYHLKHIPVLQWRYMRLRPRNFPSLRIAQLAACMYRSTSLLNEILNEKSLEEWYRYFSVNLSDYWNEHYRFDKKSSLQLKRMGKEAVHTILVNTVAVILFSYGKEKNNESHAQRAIALLLSIEKEEPAILRLFEELGMPNNNAFDSQALLHLKKNYCDEKKCLTCGIGLKIMKQT